MPRYGSVNVPITSVGVIVYGIILLTSPAASFVAKAYQQGPFLLAGQHWWGVGFVAAGLLALGIRHLLAVFPLLLFVSGWAISMALAAAAVEGVSPVAGIAWGIIAAELLVSVSVRGVAAPER